MVFVIFCPPPPNFFKKQMFLKVFGENVSICLVKSTFSASTIHIHHTLSLLFFDFSLNFMDFHWFFIIKRTLLSEQLIERVCKAHLFSDLLCESKHRVCRILFFD